MKMHFQKHGWVLVRGIFSPCEIEELRQGVIRSQAEALKGSLLSNPYLNRQSVLNDHVLSVVRSILGEDPTYFGDSNWSSGFTPGVIGFHKDNPDKERQDSPDWMSDYTIIRTGIYLQDHSQYSGGLGIRDCSNYTVDTTKGQPIFVPTQVGDMVLWSLRTTHSGFMTRLRLLPNLFIPLSILSKISGADAYSLPKFLFRSLERDLRMALFASYGIQDKHLERYIKYLCLRQYAVQTWQQSQYSDEIKMLAQKQGLQILDLHEKASQIKPESTYVDHNPNWEGLLGGVL